MAMFNISTDHDVLTITQDDTEGHADIDVRFEIDGPPMSRQHLFSSASRLKVGGLVPGEYTVSRSFRKSHIQHLKDQQTFTIGPVAKVEEDTAVDELEEINVDDLTVAEVLEYVKANPESAEYILAAEVAGKNRAGITSELS